MVQVLIQTCAPDSADELHEVAALLPFLVERFGDWPRHARIYHQDVSCETDVTPDCLEAVERLAGLEGPFIVVLYPGTGTEYPFLTVFLMFASYVVQGILAPELPTAAQRTVRNESPNNGLSDRTNQTRVNGRIPDIYGTVRSTPDLLAVPYRVFENHQEKEISFMCVGRGAYEIPIGDVRDDSTPAQEIAGMSVEVYPPHAYPNNGGSPQLRIGVPIPHPVLAVQRVGAVTGQTLEAPNSGGLYRRATRFESPNVIRSLDEGVDYSAVFAPGNEITVERAMQTDGTYSYAATSVQAVLDGQDGVLSVMGDVSSHWRAGQVMTIAGSLLTWVVSGSGDSDIEAYAGIDGVYRVESVTVIPSDPLAPGDPDMTEIRLAAAASVNGAWSMPSYGPGRGGATLSRPSGNVQFDLSGTYTITTVTADAITLSSPASVNPAWDVLRDEYGGMSRLVNPDIYISGERWVGWFTVRSEFLIDQVIINVVGLNGMYADNGEQQVSASGEYGFEVVPIGDAGEDIGPVQRASGVVDGSAHTRSMRASTLRIVLDIPSRGYRIRGRRTNVFSNPAFQGPVVDEIKWRDAYVATTLSAPDLGDVTTVYTSSFATDGALAIKDRKLNMRVTRMLPARVAGDTFTPTLHPTRSVADILSAICLDPKVGNRSRTEVDFDNLYVVADEIREYFGFDEAAEFSYTIDNDNLSFEEIVSMVAGAVGCRAYRRGSVLRLHFERETEHSAVLFNHRNKEPGSERRGLSFGTAQGFDGIEYQYVSPVDDALVTIHLPEDRSAVNPNRIESIGVRNDHQAHIHAWRAYNRLRYQCESVEFSGLAEADLVIEGERVLVADNTRTGTMDGQILSAQGLTLSLSQPVDWKTGETYTMFIQCQDAMVEAIPVLPGATARQAILGRPPRLPVVFGGDKYASTTYEIVRDADDRPARAFIVDDKAPAEDSQTVTVSAVNYDARYYERDRDFAA